MTAKIPSTTIPKSGVTLTSLSFILKVPQVSRNGHHMGRAHKYTFTGCSASNHLFQPPPSLLRNEDKPSLGSFYACDTSAEEPTPWPGTVQMAAAGFLGWS